MILCHSCFLCLKRNRPGVGPWGLICMSIAVVVGLLLLTFVETRADIYRYVDRNGVVHFSNAPTTPGYQVYLREKPSAPLQTASYRVRRTPYVSRDGNYDRYIAEAARTHGVSFSLIKAVIRAESNFDPYAVSRVGACGLMQIMPPTARDLGISDPFDPRENILGGTRYLSHLLNQFAGSVPHALAAYNAGPARVQSANGVPRIEETRDFVQRVLKYWKQY